MRHKTLLSIFILVATSACTESDNTPQPVAVPAPSIEDGLNKYANKLVVNTNNSIFGPAITKITSDTYVVEFQTSDPKLMADQNGDKDPKAFARNQVLVAAWEARFCTPELKSIIAEYRILFVTGTILDSKTKSAQSMVICSNSTASIEDNLNRIQNMQDQMDSWKRTKLW